MTQNAALLRYSAFAKHENDNLNTLHTAKVCIPTSKIEMPAEKENFKGNSGCDSACTGVYLHEHMLLSCREPMTLIILTST